MSLTLYISACLFYSPCEKHSWCWSSNLTPIGSTEVRHYVAYIHGCWNSHSWVSVTSWSSGRISWPKGPYIKMLGKIFIPSNYFWVIDVKFFGDNTNAQKNLKTSEVFQRWGHALVTWIEDISQSRHVCHTTNTRKFWIDRANYLKAAVMFWSNFESRRKWKQPWHFPVPVSGYVMLHTTWFPVLSVWSTKYRLLHIVFFSYISLSWHTFGNVSSKAATTHIFQSGVRIWPVSMSRCKIKVFNPQAQDSPERLPELSHIMSSVNP